MKEIKFATVAEELKKNPNLREQDIQVMREWVTSEFPLPSITDMLLVLFLHCTNYDIEQAKSTLVKFYNTIYNSPRLFLNRDPCSEEIRRIAQTVGVVILNGRDRDGNVVLFQRLLDTDPSRYDMDLAMKYGNMLFAAWQWEHGTAPGVVLVYDQRGFSMGHMARGSLSTMRTSVNFLQDCVPFNMKAIYVFNANTLFEAILAMFKPFMRSSLISKIRAYKEGNIEDLYQHIPQEILPEEYGGKEASLETLNERMLQKLIDMKDCFEEDDRKAFAEIEQWKKTQPEGFLQRIASWFQ